MEGLVPTFNAVRWNAVILLTWSGHAAIMAAMRSFRVLGVLLLGLAVPMGAQFSRQEERSRPNVVLITVDTLRADYLGCYGNRRIETPAVDALARDGVLFEHAYVQVPLTTPSHASMLTGAYPASHGLRDFTSPPLPAGFPTAAGFLSERGYQTAAFVSAYVLDRSWGLNQGFEIYQDSFPQADLERINPGNVQRRGEETVNLALSWMSQARSPFFLWVHLFDPHHDYDPPEPFRSRYAADLYGGEVAYVDGQIARLMVDLKKRGLYENTLVIFTSDHGESLGEHRESDHGFFLYEPVLRAPLIFKLPGDYSVGGKRVSEVSQSVDILPTVLQILRLEAGQRLRIEGRGLLGSILGKRPAEGGFAYAETFYPRRSFGWSELQCYREGRFKFIQAPKPELYDLESDPGELKNLFSSNQALSLRLQEKLAALSGRFTPAAAGSLTGADPERLRRLAALGYVSAGSSPPALRSSSLADPKDKIDVYNRILQGILKAEAGQAAESNRLLSELAAAEPELFILHYSLGVNYLRLGRPEQALTFLDKAAALNPDFSAAGLNRARSYALMGKAEQAAGILRAELAKHPEDLTIRRELGFLLSRMGNFKESSQLLQEVLRRRPDDNQALKIAAMTLVETREYEKALPLLQRLTRDLPAEALHFNYLGIALANTGQGETALEAYRRAVELKPDYEQARLNLAFTLLRAGRRAEALGAFEELCRLSPRTCAQYRPHFQ